MNTDQVRELQRKLLDLTESVERVSGERTRPQFKDFAESHLRQKLSNPTLRQATKRSFEHQVKNHLIPAFGHLPIEEISNVEFLNWVMRVRESNAHKYRKYTRFFNARKNLVEILNSAKEQGIIERLPRFDNPDEPRNVGRTLSEDETIKIIWYSYRPFRLIFYAFWRTGCRPREILQWEWSMFEWDALGRAWVNVPARISKCGRSRAVPLDPGLARLLKRKQKNANGSRFVFPARDNPAQPQISYASAWSRACSQAKVAKCVPYDFRRSFITRAAAANQPLLYVAKCLDTSSTMIEKIYAKAQAEVMADIVTYRRQGRA